MRALLWDIDGTLTKGSGAGSRALAATLHTRPAALAELGRMKLDGMTDRAIIRILLAAELGHLQGPRRQGAPPPALSRTEAEARQLSALPVEQRMAQVREEEIDVVLGGYLAQLAALCKSGAFVPQAGIAQLIPLLDREREPPPSAEGNAHPFRARGGHERVLLGLCTGNLERGAQLKLESVGLAHHFRFGGYGSDHESRPVLVKVAWQRAQALGATEGLVIDDAVRGVQAAHAAGLPVCGVATGRYSVHDLAVHGADLVIENFADLEQSLALLLGPLPRR